MARIRIIGFWLAATIATAATAGGARAGDSYAPQAQPLSPDQAHCQALGEGYFAVKGSSACIRISGYIAAGAGFVAPGRVAAPSTGPFASRARAFGETSAGVSVDSRFDTELGPGRIYVEVSHDHGQP